MLERKLVAIVWEDSYGCSANWQPTKDLDQHDPVTNYSVGWVLSENDRAIVLAPHITEGTAHCEEQACGDMIIAKSAILRRVEIDTDITSPLDDEATKWVDQISSP